MNETKYCFECGCHIGSQHQSWCSIKRQGNVIPTWKFKVLVFLGGCLIGAIASFFNGCVTSPQSGKIMVQPDTVYMGANGWVISYSPNMPTHPTTSGNGWYFDFPSQDGVHYVMVPYHANKPHSMLTITYRVTGPGRFVSVQTGCNEAADFRPMLERTGDTLSASQEFYRWWSSPPVKLVADGQPHTITYPLQWSNWNGVFGKSNQSEFAASMKDLMGVGMTFGGGCAAGHGVYITGGAAKFELINYAIN